MRDGITSETGGRAGVKAGDRIVTLVRSSRQ
jgi:hypothetical protein